jgi:DNA-binding CsgD family transcriptional regulator
MEAVVEEIRPSRPASKLSPVAGGAPRRPLGSSILSELAWREVARSLKLSPRELLVVGEIFDGQKETAIARHLGVAPRTVHTHVERLYHKLHVNDRTHLALCVMGELLALTAAPRHNLRSICPIRAAGRCPLFNGACSERDCSAGGGI